VEKRLVQQPGEPAGVVAVGVEITYTIRITNTGTTALAIVPLQDLYDANYLTFVRANPTPDTTSTGAVGWANLVGAGMLPPGSALSVTVTFQTRQATDSQPNRQTLNVASLSNVQDELGHQPQPPVVSDLEPVRIARSAVAVSKMILSPDLSGVGVGQDITFGIRVENVGEVTLAQIPVYDLYEADVLEYLRTNVSQPRVTITGTQGELYWSDITNIFGDLAPGQAVQFSATFRMIAPRTTTNVVRVDDVVDANNEAVPPAQGLGSVEVVPVATAIYQLFAPFVGNQSVDVPTPTPSPTPTPTPAPVVDNTELPCPAPGCPVSGLLHPKGMTVHTGLNRLYISSRDTNQLIVLDARTLAPIVTVETGAEPWDVVINEGTNEAFVSNYASNDVWVYDANTLALKQVIHVGPQPALMEIFPDINTVAVVVRGLNGIAMIENGAVVQYVPSGGIGPYGIAADQVNKQLIVGNRDTGNAWIFYKDGTGWQMASGSEMKNFGGQERTGPFEIAYNPNNQRIYVISMRPSGTWFVDVIEKQSMNSLTTLATLDVGSSGSDRDGDVGGTGLEVNLATGNVFVANTYDKTLSVISGQLNQVVATIPTGEDPFEITSNPVTNQIFVTLRRPNRIQKFADLY